MTGRSARRGVAVLVLALAGCSGGGGDAEVAPPTTDAADVRFCRVLADTDDDPVPDPFEPGLEPAAVHARLSLLRSRLEGYRRAAPPALEDRIDELVTSLRALDRLLEGSGYDFAVLAGSGADVAAFDSPAFARLAVDLAAYRREVCDL